MYEIEIEELPGLQNYEAEIEICSNFDDCDDELFEQYLEYEKQYLEELTNLYTSEVEYWEEYDRLKCLILK
jgi:hypothetical protein